MQRGDPFPFPECLLYGRSLAEAIAGDELAVLFDEQQQKAEIGVLSPPISIFGYSRSEINTKIPLCELQGVKLTAILLGTPCTPNM